MNLCTKQVGSAVVAELVGEIDTIDNEGFGNALTTILAAKPASLVLDFSGVRYIASAGISLLLQLARDLRKNGSTLVIASANPAVKTVLDTVHLGAVIPMAATVEEALGRAGVKSAVPA
jgi:anti-sigma B factor antagonist